MLLILAAVLAGVLIGLLAGGSLNSLAQTRLRLWGLAILGLALQVLPPLREDGPLGRGGAWTVLAVSYALVFAFLGLNLRVRGMSLVAAGIFLNALVIGINWGMPVSDSALRSASGSMDEYVEARRALIEGGSVKHHLANSSDDIMLQLSDVIGIGWPLNQVLSLGDILATAGISWILASSTRGPGGKHRRVRRVLGGAREARPPLAHRHRAGARLGSRRPRPGAYSSA